MSRRLALLLLFAIRLYAVESVPMRAIVVLPTPSTESPMQSEGVAPVLAMLPAVPVDELQMLRANGAVDGPPIVGITRPLPEPIDVKDGGSAAAASISWRGSVIVEGAAAVRLQITGIEALPGTRAWTYGSTGEAVEFSLHDADPLWTPSVAGNTATIEISGFARFRIEAVADLRVPATDGAACLQDATCQNSQDLRNFGSAIAHMRYRRDSDGTWRICSGALISDRADTFRPYFLTANHCVGSSTEAASLETFWDYRTATCGGLAPALQSLQKITGAQLLVTSAATDTTLLLLSKTPSGSPRFFLGWSTSAVTAGTIVHRISHPDGFPQAYSASRVETSSTACIDRPRSRYLYSQPTFGTIIGGSSGAPVITADGRILGQLFGECPGGADSCGPTVRTVDGAFSVSYSILKPHIDPEVATTCTPSSTVACLLSNRFKVAINYKNQFSNPPGAIGDFRAARLSQSTTNPDVGIFGFASAQNVEVLVRVQDARPFAPRFDIYYGGMTDVEYWVNVTDTATGTTRQYHNAPGKVGGGVDRSSFPAN